MNTVKRQYGFYNRAFSLIELSIVLVIVGLLVGGVIAGQAMISTAHLRDVRQDVVNYTAAIENFQKKYKALPGDFSTATGIWGKSAAACNGHTGTAALPGTCNGDGNGQIGMTAGGIPEFLRAWQQLQLANMIEGDFSGVSGTGFTWHHIINPTATNLRNAPSSKLQGGGYSLYYQAEVSGGANATLYDNRYGHVIVFGGQSGGGNTSAPTVGTTSTPILTAEDAYMIDQKFDDGIPNTGTILATKSGGASVIPSCTTAGNAYDLTTTTRNCILIFNLGL